MQKKILIVDDEREAVEILGKKIGENNYSVMTALTGKDAISICNKEKPDLVILDIVISDMDGYAVAAALRENKLLRNVPIIFTSGKEFDYAGIEERLSEVGPCDYMTKPFSVQELLAKIKEALG